MNPNEPTEEFTDETTDIFDELYFMFLVLSPFKQQRAIGNFEGLALNETAEDLKDLYLNIAATLKAHSKPIKKSVQSLQDYFAQILEEFPTMPADQKEIVVSGLTGLAENGETESYRRFGSEILKIILNYDQEIKAFETAPETAEKPAGQPLDLSNSSIDDLSQKLSDIMQNPLLPDSIRSCISEQLFEDLVLDTTSPVIIKEALLSPKE